MKVFFFLSFLLFCSGLAHAFDCTVFSSPDYDSCITLNTSDEDSIANLIYTNTSYPDHSFIDTYNRGIVVNDAPFGYSKSSKGVIQNAWVALLTLQPTVWYHNALLGHGKTQSRAEYNYDVTLPPNYYSGGSGGSGICKILYNVQSQKEQIQLLNNGVSFSNAKTGSFQLNSNATIAAQLDVSVTTRAREYDWQAQCCGYMCSTTCYSCSYQRTKYATDTLALQDTKNIAYYDHVPNGSFTLTTQLIGSTIGILSKDNLTNVDVRFNQSSYEDYEFTYSANFTAKPYYLIILQADEQHTTTRRNLLASNTTIIVADASNCTLESEDFFNKNISSCAGNIQPHSFVPFTKKPFAKNAGILFIVGLLLLLVYLFFRIGKRFGGKLVTAMVFMMALVPTVHAASCSISNLATCIPQSIFDFIVNLLNEPLQPLLDFIRTLLETPVDVSLFHTIWQIMVTIISLFYGLLFVYAGYLFLFSGHDAARRTQAKETLKNAVLMIFFVQASYFLYELVVEVGASLASSILALVDPAFFQLTANNIVNVGLEFLLIVVYVVVLLFTMVLFVIRYIVVAVGVIFAPLAIFCYYIPPLRSYGKLILNLLGMTVFVTFLAAVMILACSMLAQIPIFQNFTIVVMIVCFLLIDLTMILLGKHIITKSALGGIGENVAQAARFVGGML